MQVDIKVHQLLVEVINKLRYAAIQIIVVAIGDEDLSTIVKRRWMSYSKRGTIEGII